MTLSDDDIESIKCALTHYLMDDYRHIADLDKIIENREEVDDNVFMYPCPCQTIWLDDTFYAVTYANQRVVDDKYQYNFSGIPVDPSEDNGDLYSYSTSLEWMRESIFD